VVSRWCKTVTPIVKRVLQCRSMKGTRAHPTQQSFCARSIFTFDRSDTTIDMRPNASCRLQLIDLAGCDRECAAVECLCGRGVPTTQNDCGMQPTWKRLFIKRREILTHAMQTGDVLYQSRKLCMRFIKLTGTLKSSRQCPVGRTVCRAS
jgi:hypothetical protein